MSSILSKITSPAKKQENGNCSPPKICSIETYTEIPQVTEFTKMCKVTFYMFTSLKVNINESINQRYEREPNGTSGTETHNIQSKKFTE